MNIGMFFINLNTKSVLSNTSYNLGSLIIISQKASFLISLVGLCKHIESQAPNYLCFLVFPTLGKWFAFKLLVCCMHHNNPLATKRNLRLSKFKHCMQACQDIRAFVTMQRMHLDVEAFLRHINIVNLGQRAKLVGDWNYVCFCCCKAYNNEKYSVVVGLVMEKNSSHNLGQSKHFHWCMLGNWKFSVVKCVMTKNFQLPNLQWSKFIHHQSCNDQKNSFAKQLATKCFHYDYGDQKVFRHHM